MTRIVEGVLEKISGFVWDVRPVEHGGKAILERYCVSVRVGEDMRYSWFENKKVNIENMRKLERKIAYWEVNPEGDINGLISHF